LVAPSKTGELPSSGMMTVDLAVMYLSQELNQVMYETSPPAGRPVAGFWRLKMNP
jgi:hypothetical protein